MRPAALGAPIIMSLDELDNIRVNGFDGCKVATLLYKFQVMAGICKNDFLQFLAAGHQLVYALKK
jgi:hypothetical protein